MIILLTFVVSFSIAFILGCLLGIFKKIFYMPVNPKIEQIRDVLPGANCGACGYPGCDAFAKAVANNEAPVDGCSAGSRVAAEIAKLMGVSAKGETYIAVLACRGSKEHALDKGHYIGVKTCKAAKISINGTKSCQWGCIGFGDCVSACKFDAIKIGQEGLPIIDRTKCTGCASCVKVCPNELLKRVNVNAKGAFAFCSNRSGIKPSILKNCKNGCIKCGKCEKSCEVNAIKLEKGIPVIDYEICTACGTCVKNCPTKVLNIL